MFRGFLQGIAAPVKCVYAHVMAVSTDQLFARIESRYEDLSGQSAREFGASPTLRDITLPEEVREVIEQLPPIDVVVNNTTRGWLITGVALEMDSGRTI